MSRCPTAGHGVESTCGLSVCWKTPYRGGLLQASSFQLGPLCAHRSWHIAQLLWLRENAPHLHSQHFDLKGLASGGLGGGGNSLLLVPLGGKWTADLGGDGSSHQAEREPPGRACVLARSRWYSFYATRGVVGGRHVLFFPLELPKHSLSIGLQGGES